MLFAFSLGNIFWNLNETIHRFLSPENQAMRYMHLSSSTVMVLVVVCSLLTKSLYMVSFLHTSPLNPFSSELHHEVVHNKTRNHMGDNMDSGTMAARFGIVYMGNEHHFGVQRGNFQRGSCPNVYVSLQSLSRYFPTTNDTKHNNNSNNNSSSSSHFYPEPVVIILHDDILSASMQEALQNASRFPMEFHSIVYAQPQDEKWANDSLINYERMCAFWFHYFFEVQGLPDYIMQLDTDTCITSDMRINPFHYMVENKMEYMYHSTFLEPPEVIVDLKDFFLENPGQPVNNHSILIPWQSKGVNHGAMEVISTNLEWFYMPAFRRPSILEWREKVWHNGGIFRHRWGDAPLRTTMVLTMFHSNRVSRFCPFSYNHSFWYPFNSCKERSGIFVDLDGWNIVTLNQ